ncbi:MAG TPA: hypothetical protein VL171_18820 [Verrucomicrobiae bacterium]|nr:hypothetical protein [Verrucomicrobiae bacterium]
MVGFEPDIFQGAGVLDALGTAGSECCLHLEDGFYNLLLFCTELFRGKPNSLHLSCADAKRVREVVQVRGIGQRLFSKGDEAGD